MNVRFSVRSLQAVLGRSVDIAMGQDARQRGASEMMPRSAHRLRKRAGLAALAVMLSTPAAFAQPIDGEFAVQRWNPAPGPRNFFTTRGARTDGQMTFSGGLFLNYANKPFVVESCISETNCDEADAPSDDVYVVENMITADALASLTVVPRVQIGLRIPLTWVDGQGITDEGFASRDGLSGVGLGDPEIEGKFRLVGGVRDPLVIGAAAFVTAPLGRATAEGKYIGDNTPTVGARGIVDVQAGALSVAGNLAGLYRGEGNVGSTELGPEFRYNVAAGVKLSPVFRVIGEGFGATNFTTKEGANTLELNLGVQVVPLGSSLAISAGAGRGIVSGVGSPDVRAFAGFVYSAEAQDRDGDGILDSDDQCPTQAEDRDGSEDHDGCPDTDDDGDGIGDDVDKCPKQAEDLDGFQDADGCPDEDNDNDGVPDTGDRCPAKAETKNGFDDDDGCPDEPDADGDGVPDAKDRCKDEPEDTDGFEDTDGCPDPDNDKDGVPDNADECVDEPETKNGFEDGDGCPDTAPAKKR